MGKNLTGRQLLGQYRVDSFTGHGAMADIYKVWDAERSVFLAMKVLTGEYQDDPSVLKHFRREARALQKLAHPNIVRFYGIFQTEEITFILEHFIDGHTLQDLIRSRKGKPAPIREVLTCLKVLCAALGYAHNLGVIHCDVKPGNVMVDQSGHIFLTDFGIARHAESTTTTLKGAGTAPYMAPEQFRGEEVTGATDIYALGVMLYEMLTGKRPFRGDSGTSDTGGAIWERIRNDHLHTPPPDARELNPHAPPALAAVAQKAMAKDPADRFHTTGEMLEAALAAVAPASRPAGDLLSPASWPAITASQDEPVVPPAGPIPPPEPYPPPVPPGNLDQETAERLNKNRKKMLIFFCAAAVVILVMILALAKPGTPQPPTTAQVATAGASAPQGNQAVAIATVSLRPTQNYHLAFASDHDGTYSVWVLDTNAPEQRTQLKNPPGTGGAWWPSFCGEALAVEVCGKNCQEEPAGIYLVNAKTAAAEKFAIPQSPGSSLLLAPRCSPDNRYIAYSLRQADGALDLRVFDRTNQVEVFSLNKRAPETVGAKYAGNAAWASDSNTFVASANPKMPLDIYYQVYRAQINGKVERLQTGMYGALSPDGKHIAYICNVSNLCLDRDDQVIAPVKPLLNRNIPTGTPFWSPDGAWIFYSSAENGNYDVWMVAADRTGSPINLTGDWASDEFQPVAQW